MQIELPTEVEQLRLQAVIKRLGSKTESLRQRFASRGNDIADLRQSILQKAFAGELI